MCGIFGGVFKDITFSYNLLFDNIKKLFILSESRGKEAAGIAFLIENIIDIYKDSLPAHKMINTKEYKDFFINIYNKLKKNSHYAFIGHTRLVTNGLQAIDFNNQPVKKDGIVLVHNGIITNEKLIWEKYGLTKRTDLDSEVIPAMIRFFLKKNYNIYEAVKKTYNEIEGEASIGAFFEDYEILLLATNVGSLYYTFNENVFIVVSEEYICKRLLKGKYKIKGLNQTCSIKNIRPNEMLIIDLNTMKIHHWNFSESSKSFKNIIFAPKLSNRKKIEDKYEKLEERRNNLKRCVKCILPETMPFIKFDESGVCNYCKNYVPLKLKGREKLEELLSKYRSKEGKHDCIVAFSGGRDSSYALHILKNEFKMNPIAYTYDWGMVTSIARRNQARMTGKLGIEHIWVSADIKWKRKNISKNVKAWLKRPKLGMIPIFIAGDKQFFYYANKLMNQTGINLMIFSQNPYEQTEFKSGFANVPPTKFGQNAKYYRLDLNRRFKLAIYYGKEFLLNPRYLNSSIFDTIFAYISYYFLQQNYLFIYDYLPWNEKKINDTLINEYNWEIDPEYPSTWRIGDGTAAFYNYIYYTVAGFTENDTLRSNQIREGQITRDEALKKVKLENRPRWDAIREYLELINLDFDDVIKIIDKIPKLY